MKTNIILATIIGLILAAINMYIAWQHNPQCEIHCEGEIDWFHWFLIGISWLLAGFIVTLIATISFRSILALTKDRKLN